jgi:aminoglycoside phosphotransferase (APT) family kinase protein
VHGAEAYVVRLPGPARYVNRALEERNARAAEAMGIGATVVRFDAASGVMVTRVVPRARPLAGAALRDPAVLGRVARALRTLHAGSGFAGRLDPAEKIALYARGLRAAGGPAGALDLVPAGLDLAARAAAEGTLVPCHNDPVPDNLLDDGRRVTLVDWEYAGFNDPLWDLAYLAIEGGLDGAAEEALLAAYRGQAEGGVRGRFARQKTLCLLVSGLWATLAALDPGAAPTLADYAADRLARARALLESPPRPMPTASPPAEDPR